MPKSTQGKTVCRLQQWIKRNTKQRSDFTALLFFA